MKAPGAVDVIWNVRKGDVARLSRGSVLLNDGFISLIADCYLRQMALILTKKVTKWRVPLISFLIWFLLTITT